MSAVYIGSGSEDDCFVFHIRAISVVNPHHFSLEVGYILQDFPVQVLDHCDRTKTAFIYLLAYHLHIDANLL